MNITVNRNINFRGPLDGVITNTLRACDTNEIVNAVGLDIGAMVIPRTYYDTKARNEYAGAETFFREISGTFINCLSAGLLAQIISRAANKFVEPDTKINPKSWYSQDSLTTLEAAWNKTKNTKDFVSKVMENISGTDGYNTKKFNNINWKNVEWIDEKNWNNLNWDNSKYSNIKDKLTTKEGFVNTLSGIITDKNITNQDKNNVLQIMESRMANALGVEREIAVKIDDKKVTTNLHNILRDTCDIGRDIFNNKNVNAANAIKKISKINKIKAFGAIAGSCILGLTNQHINRKITEKRSGKKGFVGDIDFMNDNRKEAEKDKFLFIKKLSASALMAGMVFSVMRVKNFKDFAKKLEFTGPVSSGNAIKTVYASTIIGRFMAADNGCELRESMTRDYLGFLNWLVFGGFAAKGVANLLDRKGDKLFNYTQKGKGLKHWLNDMSIKTHSEVASKGKDFAKKNIWKLNVAQASGIAYSAITLGLLLPMLNAKITEHKQKKKQIYA